ncbi:MAG: hypothetical protein J7J85_05655, partial [Deltaproteobacteria bacterium]|nr:hypothetical protein [Deltaproteobacteria bacterium]
IVDKCLLEDLGKEDCLVDSRCAVPKVQVVTTLYPLDDRGDLYILGLPALNRYGQTLCYAL